MAGSNYRGLEKRGRSSGYAAHRTPEIKDWLAANPPVTVHFTPTRASSMSLVEVWVSVIERQAIHRGIYTSVKDLKHLHRRL
ncbi:hypothetical protein [Cellulomonas sp. P24]|uniref:hypothetical protein n=1 Tax=Cellulomonas sp. P24 TaxID=2885206 RepID=UPI00216AB520|nr:hypothetical protein [Cellulomonas sp. P24]MCR6493524.1 hypothetical protein [Cellulomonas sp. P24]